MAVNWTNVTNPQTLIASANNSTNGFFWTATVYLLWLVIMLATINYGIGIALLTSTFLALIISIFFVYAGLMAWEGALFFVGILIFYILYNTWSSND